MGKNRKLLVPEARPAVNQLKERVMKGQGFTSSTADLKYEVANDIGIPLQQGYNGDIKAKQAGQIGGSIGGNMVKEMIRMAEEQLRNHNKRG